MQAAFACRNRQAKVPRKNGAPTTATGVLPSRTTQNVRRGMQRTEAAPRALGSAKERAVQRGIDKIGGIEENRCLLGLWKLFNTRTSAGVDAIANPEGLVMPAHFNYTKTSDGILLHCKAVKGLSQVEARAIFSIGG